MATIKENPVFRLTHVSAEEKKKTVCLRGWLSCLGPNNVATKVRSFRSWAWRNCRPSAPRTAPSPDDSDGWQHREGYTGDSAQHRRPDTAIAAFALCLPLYQQSPDQTMPNYLQEQRFFPSVESRRWIHQTADSMSAGLLGRGGKKTFAPSDNASDHDVFPITAVFGPSVAESRSSARVDGSQLHMRRDPAHSPIDRQRNASLLFPGLALTGTLCHIRLGLSCLFGTKNI